MPDSIAYRSTTIFAISYISLTMAGIYDMLRVLPKAALVDASTIFFCLLIAIFSRYKTQECSRCERPENTVSCCINLVHDENNKYLHEK